MSIEYTDWFPPEIKPVRKGLYLIKYGAKSECWHMGFWNGKSWYAAEAGINGHFTESDALGGWSHYAAYHWRGLTAPAGRYSSV